jgi:hypothetical protein
MSRVAPHIVRDLGAKLVADVDSAMHRAVDLVDDAHDRHAVAAHALVSILGATAAYWSESMGMPRALQNKLDPLDIVIAMLFAMKKKEQAEMEARANAKK